MRKWQRKLSEWVAVDSTGDERELSRKGIATAIFVPSLYATEWFLVAVTAAIVTLLKHYGLTDTPIWLILWGLNLMVSGAVIVFGDRFKLDITLMQSLRKLSNAITKRTKVVGILIETCIVIRLLLWDGSAHLLIFFRERIPSNLLRVCLFVFASGFQMFVWAKLYILGYDSLTGLLSGL